MVCIAVDTVSALEASRPCRNSGKPGKWYRQIMRQLLSPPLRAAPSAAGLELSSSSVQDLLLCSVYTKQGVTTELIVPSLWFNWRPCSRLSLSLPAHERGFQVIMTTLWDSLGPCSQMTTPSLAQMKVTAHISSLFQFHLPGIISLADVGSSSQRHHWKWM